MDWQNYDPLKLSASVPIKIKKKSKPIKKAVPVKKATLAPVQQGPKLLQVVKVTQKPIYDPF